MVVDHLSCLECPKRERNDSRENEDAFPKSIFTWFKKHLLRNITVHGLLMLQTIFWGKLFLPTCLINSKINSCPM